MLNGIVSHFFFFYLLINSLFIIDFNQDYLQKFIFSCFFYILSSTFLELYKVTNFKINERNDAQPKY